MMFRMTPAQGSAGVGLIIIARKSARRIRRHAQNDTAPRERLVLVCLNYRICLVPPDSSIHSQ